MTKYQNSVIRINHFNNEIIIGDFNDKLSKKLDETEDLVGNHGTEPKWTWQKRKIQRILIRQWSLIKNTEVINKIAVGSDHWMVRATMCLNTKLERHEKFDNKRQNINSQKIRERNVQKQLQKIEPNTRGNINYYVKNWQVQSKT